MWTPDIVARMTVLGLGWLALWIVLSLILRFWLHQSKWTSFEGGFVFSLAVPLALFMAYVYFSD